LADGGYARRHAECEAAAHKLGVAALSYAGAASIEHLDDPLLRARARHVHSENARVRGFVAELVADTPSAERLGALLDASHASLRDDFAVSTAELDLAASAARRAGAFGARMVGAGFGGSVLALVPRGSAGTVAAAAAGAFGAAALPAPRSFPAVAD